MTISMDNFSGPSNFDPWNIGLFEEATSSILNSVDKNIRTL